MIYTRDMVVRIALFAIPLLLLAGLVLLLNALDAAPGIAIASFSLLAVSTGAAIGYFADRLSGPQRARRSHRLLGARHAD